MKNAHKIADPAFNAEEFIVRPVFAFLSKHQSELWLTARFLGGYEAARLVDRCAALLERDRALTDRTRMMLGRIASMLALEHNGNTDRRLMGYFVVIDPCDPVVEEIRCLSDRLSTALSQAEERRIWTEARMDSRRSA